MLDDTTEIYPARYEEDFDFDFDLRAPPEDGDTIQEDNTSTDSTVISQRSDPLVDNNSDIEDDDNDNNYGDGKIVEEIDDIRSSSYCEPNESYHQDKTSNGNNSDLDVAQTNYEVTNGQIYKDQACSNQNEDFSNQIIENNIDSDKLQRNGEKFSKKEKHNPNQNSQVFPFDNEGSQNICSIKEFSSAVQMPLSPPAIVGDVKGSYNTTDTHRLSSSSIPSSPQNISSIFSKSTASEISDLNDVIVTYQANDYHLFSTSDSDDPNTFFIKDRTIAQKSLCDFFRAIRDVVHDDLDNENELFMLIPDFSLQIEETSVLLQNIVFSQLVSLRKKLILNDGIDEPPPMYIELGIRRNFEKELRKITKFANDGKGLSELAIWNDNGKDFQDFIVNDGDLQSPSDKQFNCNTSTMNNEPEETILRHEVEYSNEISLQEEEDDDDNEDEDEVQFSEKALESEPEQGQQSSNGSDLSATTEVSTSKSSYPVESTEYFSNEITISPESKPTKWDVVFHNSFDAESDIIDYSEDEVEDCIKHKVQTNVVINDDKIDTCYSRKKSSTKSPIVSDGENTKLLVCNVSKDNTEFISCVQDIKGENFEYYTATHLSEIKTKKIHHGLDPNINEYHNTEQGNNLESPLNQMTDPTTLVENSDDEKVNFHQLNTIEFNEITEQTTQDEAQKNPSKIQFDENINQPNKDIVYPNFGEFSKEDMVDISHQTVDDTVETSTIQKDKVSKTSRKLSFSSDRYIEKPLVDPSQELETSYLGPSTNEDEDEINYDGDENDKNEVYKIIKKDSSSNLIRPQVFISKLSNGKRSRAECKLDISMDRRDVKHARL